MKLRKHRCSSCGEKNVIPLSKIYKCLSCGKETPRFIKPVRDSPLFLNVEVKGEETKKFLEDVGRKKMNPKEWRPAPDLQHMLHYKNGKVVEVLTIGQYMDRMVGDIREFVPREGEQ